MLDYRGLPSRPLAQFRRLPETPAVYFIVCGDLLLYVGSTTNLKLRPLDPNMQIYGRWAEVLFLAPSSHVHWLEWSDRDTISLMREFEAQCIRRLNPLLNIQHNANTHINQSISLDLLRHEAITKRTKIQSDYIRFVAMYEKRLWDGLYLAQCLYYANDNFRDDDESFDAFTCFLTAFQSKEQDALVSLPSVHKPSNKHHLIDDKLWIMYSLFGTLNERVKYVAAVRFFGEEIFAFAHNDNLTSGERIKALIRDKVALPLVVVFGLPVVVPFFVYLLLSNYFGAHHKQYDQHVKEWRLWRDHASKLEYWWFRIAREEDEDTERYFLRRRHLQDQLEATVGLPLRIGIGGNWFSRGA